MIRNCLLILLVIAGNAFQSKAQVSVRADGFFIKEGTQLSLEGLGMVPSSDLILENNQVESRAEVVEWPLYNSVEKLVWFKDAINFSGAMSLNIPSILLNGNERDSLNIAFADTQSNDYKDFSILSDGLQVADHVLNILGQPYRLNRVTAVNRKFVKAAYPLDISLSAVSLHESSPAGTLAGALSSTSHDPNATFTYSLVSGSGDSDNSLFAIIDNKLQTATSLNFEQKAVYSVRVRSTTQRSLSLDKELLITITDVNEQPTLADIADQTICYTTANQTVTLTGISAGQDAGQSTALSISSTNNALFRSLNVSHASNGSAQVSYEVASGVTGTAVVTILVQDDGGTANSGTDMILKSFTITVNPLPVIVISSDMGMTLSKGETAVLTAASDGTYQWASAFGIISGQNTATLTVRPEETTTYRVTVTNANGCSTEQEITIVVKADYEVVKGTNIISPNGDGINDRFIIKNIDMYPKNVVKIFDQAGRILYNQNNYSDQWNGTSNGSPLAEGTYYYVVDFGPTIPRIKGYITIVRDN